MKGQAILELPPVRLDPHQCQKDFETVCKRAAEFAELFSEHPSFSISCEEMVVGEPAKIQGLLDFLAKDTLHHVLELEHLFDAIHERLEQDGVFLTTDMIGRNGHRRWPEALEIIRAIWKFIPDHYKINHQLKRVEKEYDNWGCSKKGFEGIRAQDILPLLVEKFIFRGFLGCGNLPDIFIERGFGHNLDVDNPHDTGFIDFLEYLNSLLIDLGYLKPTMIYGAMTRRKEDPPEPRCYRHLDTQVLCSRSRP